MNLQSGLSAFLRRMGLSSSNLRSIWPSASSSTMGDLSISPSSSTPLLELSGLDVRMSRRNLLKLLATSAAVATTVDIEQLLWVPKPIIVVPAIPGTYGAIERAEFPFWRNQAQFVAAAWDEAVGRIPTDNIFERHWLLENLK